MSYEFLHQLGDFANIFKAFIGSNYLGIAFSFSQSGLWLGIAGLILIALATDHCCILIIKCKKKLVQRLLFVPSSTQADESSIQDDAPLMNRYLELEKELSYGQIGRLIFGKWGLWVVNSALVITQFGFCVGYFIFLGNSLPHLFPVLTLNISQQLHFNESSSNTNHASAWTPISDAVYQSRAPSYFLLLLIPLPILLLTSMIKDVRRLAPISVIADVSICLGFFSIFYFIVVHFSMNANFASASWSTFPIFFGQVTSMFEGIGTIVSIESSMKGNRQRFTMYLHASMGLMVVILGTFGVLGYLKFGPLTQQIIILNLSDHDSHVIIMTVYATLCIGVLFTYPLQLVPVIEVVESLMPVQKDAKDSEITLLLKKPRPLSTWKRNILRFILVLCTAAVAAGLRDQFAYFGAFIGAVGSSVLAYVLPCMFHLKLHWGQVHWLVAAKDCSLIAFGVVGSCVSLYALIWRWVQGS